mmetsp:Transcript_16959/g.23597  ORF Transcript_16959/g.23597 Transcript_16959/m.23597 type:complete len:211 (+) Transcript_16959:434-1066(+)
MATLASTVARWMNATWMEKELLLSNPSFMEAGSLHGSTEVKKALKGLLEPKDGRVMTISIVVAFIALCEYNTSHFSLQGVVDWCCSCCLLVRLPSAVRNSSCVLLESAAELGCLPAVQGKEKCWVVVVVGKTVQTAEEMHGVVVADNWRWEVARSKQVAEDRQVPFAVKALHSPSGGNNQFEVAADERSLWLVVEEQNWVHESQRVVGGR